MEETEDQNPQMVGLTAGFVCAYVGNNRVPAAELSALLRSVHATFAEITAGAGAATAKPAVPIRRSVTPDYIICLEDGKKLTILRRYLRSRYGMTPEQYRAKWNLPHDYPMVAPNYSERRSQFAKKIGLGHKRKTQPKRRRA